MQRQHKHMSFNIQHKVFGAIIAKLLMCGHLRIDFGNSIRFRHAALHDSDTTEVLRLQPLLVLQRDHQDLALYAADIAITGCKGREKLRLFAIQLLVGLVYREVKIGRKRGIPPRFALLKMITERIVIAREHEHYNSGQDDKDSQAKNSR